MGGVYLVEVHSVRCRVPGHQHDVLIQRAGVESVIRVCQNLQRSAKLQIKADLQ